MPYEIRDKNDSYACARIACGAVRRRGASFRSSLQFDGEVARPGDRLHRLHFRIRSAAVAVRRALQFLMVRDCGKDRIDERIAPVMQMSDGLKNKEKNNGSSLTCPVVVAAGAGSANVGRCRCCQV